MDLSRNRPVINYEAAARLVAEAVKHAASGNWVIAVVVVDPSGHIVASARMDGVPAPIIEFAADKAYTAVTLQQSTMDLAKDMAESQQQEMGAANRPRLCAWDGGVPIVENGLIIGGLGVSGAPGPIDIECGAKALAALGLE
jgi:glc operon protein GlcG